MIGEPRALPRRPGAHAAPSAFAAKLGLVIDPEAAKPIREMAPLLENVPPARLFDEMLKLLTSGHAVKCPRRSCAKPVLHHGLLPLLDVILEQPLGERFVMLALENTDQRVRDGKPISPGFLFATLLWHEVLAKWGAHQAGWRASDPALFIAMDEVLDTQAEKLAITRRIAGDIKDIWAIQPRFEARAGRKPTPCWNSRASRPVSISCCCAPPRARCRPELARLVGAFLFAGATNGRRCCCRKPATRRKPASAQTGQCDARCRRNRQTAFVFTLLPEPHRLRRAGRQPRRPADDGSTGVR